MGFDNPAFFSREEQPFQRMDISEGKELCGCHSKDSWIFHPFLSHLTYAKDAPGDPTEICISWVVHPSEFPRNSGFVLCSY